MHREFWDAFTEKLRERLGKDAEKLLLFGEVYNGDAQYMVMGVDGASNHTLRFA